MYHFCLLEWHCAQPLRVEASKEEGKPDGLFALQSLFCGNLKSSRNLRLNDYCLLSAFLTGNWMKVFSGKLLILLAALFKLFEAFRHLGCFKKRILNRASTWDDRTLTSKQSTNFPDMPVSFMQRVFPFPKSLVCGYLISVGWRVYMYMYRDRELCMMIIWSVHPTAHAHTHKSQDKVVLTRGITEMNETALEWTRKTAPSPNIAFPR